MKNLRLTMLTAAAVALLAAGAAAAGDPPAQAGRIWAAPGDHVGLFTHATLTLDGLDDYGAVAKAAEDWPLTAQYRFSSVFAWNRTWDTGRWLTLRGAGENGGRPGGAGSLGLWGGSTGGFRTSVTYRSFDHYYDGTSEMRSAAFAAPPPPAAIDPAPVMNWNRFEAAGYHRVWNGFGLEAGVAFTRRDGTKGSLLRSGAGGAVPGLKHFGTLDRKVWAGGDYAYGKLATDWEVSYRKSEGDRALGTRHLFTDDRTLWSGRVGGALEVSPTLRLVGQAAGSYLESNPHETQGLADRDVASDAVSGTGRVGALWTLSRGTRLDLSAAVRNQNVDGQVGPDDAVVHAVDRDLTSQDYRAALSTTRLPSTRLQLSYRYRTSDLEETTAQGGVPGSGVEGDFQSTDRQRTSREAALRARTRLAHDVTLKAKATWLQEEIDSADTWDTTGGDSWFYWMGDRKRDKLVWEVCLNTRPAAGLSLDLGHQAIAQTFEREDVAGVETTWDAVRGFAVATWAAAPRLTLLGSFSMGQEEYGITGAPVVASDVSPLAYDATTVRYAPGAVLDLGRGWNCEGHYEAVRTTDSVENDLDRWSARTSWRFAEKLTATASYRRCEFDENRWDDYIFDQYSLSVGGVF